MRCRKRHPASAQPSSIRPTQIFPHSFLIVYRQAILPFGRLATSPRAKAAATAVMSASSRRNTRGMFGMPTYR